MNAWLFGQLPVSRPGARFYLQSFIRLILIFKPDHTNLYFTNADVPDNYAMGSHQLLKS